MHIDSNSALIQQSRASSIHNKYTALYRGERDPNFAWKRKVLSTQKYNELEVEPQLTAPNIHSSTQQSSQCTQSLMVSYPKWNFRILSGYKQLQFVAIQEEETLHATVPSIYYSSSRIQYTPLDVQRLDITKWLFLNYIARITRNSHKLSQFGNQINCNKSIGLDLYQRPCNASVNDNFQSVRTEEGSEPSCFGLQKLDP